MSKTKLVKNKKNYLKKWRQVFKVVVTVLTALSLFIGIIMGVSTLAERRSVRRNTVASTDTLLNSRDLSDVFECLNFLVAVREAIGKTHGVIFASDFEGVEVLDAGTRGISSFAGLEYFIDLIELNISGNEVDFIDISNNTALEVLIARNMGLASLCVSNNRALRVLRLARNNIGELNLYYNRALEELELDWNFLRELDLSHHTRMQSLSINVTPIEKLYLWDLRQINVFRYINTPIANDRSRIMIQGHPLPRD